MKIADFLDRLDGVRQSGDGFMARCPSHDDERNSLSVCEGRDQRILLTCFAGCEANQIVDALGLELKDLFNGANGKTRTGSKSERVIVEEYDYGDFIVARTVPKGFFQYRRGPNGTKIFGLGAGTYTQGRHGDWYPSKDGDCGTQKQFDAVARKRLYREDKVLEAFENGKKVFLVEGERDVHTLESLRFTATTNAGGASKWSEEYTKVLNQGAVIILPDADAPGLKHAQSVKQQLRDAAILELPGLPPKGDVTDWVRQGGTREELITLARQAFDDRDTVPAAAPEASTTKAIKSLHLSELSNARRFQSRHGAVVRHDSTLGYLVWDGRRWARAQKAAERRAHSIGQIIREEAKERKGDPEVVKKYFKAALEAEKAKGVRATLELARALEGIDADHVEWDADPWTFNAWNGTIDLKTGKLHPHNRDDHITKLAPVSYDREAKAPRWEQFLLEVFDGDGEVAEYLQWFAGYAMTGVTSYHCFAILHGAGRNGKTTLESTLQKVWGPDYSQQLDAETLMAQKYARHSTDLAALRGIRLAVCAETTEGRRLNESLVKSIIGGDRLRARFMRQDSFEFVPQLHLLLSTNHRPRIRDSSLGMWSRIRLLPFERTFGKANCDPNLPSKLESELTGILAWCVRGALRVQDGEPPLPKAVAVATQNYREEEDTLAEFISEECEIHEHIRVGKGDLFRAFHTWSDGRCVSRKAFTALMRARGFGESRMHGGRECWLGIALSAKNLQKGGEVR